jgi:hypothetical protein
MLDPASELLRIPLLGTWVNKREGALSVLTIHREFIADH